VKTPAADARAVEATMQRSLRRGPERLMPQATVEQENPMAAFTPPGIRLGRVDLLGIPLVSRIGIFQHFRLLDGQLPYFKEGHPFPEDLHAR
jgi:hypothetical protein